MSEYIVCQKKRNNPRMNVRICRKKCELKDECPEYQSINDVLAEKDEMPAVQLAAA